MNIDDPEKQGLLDRLFAFALPETSWLDRRMDALKVAKPVTDDQGDLKPFTRNAYAGGQTTKEGAEYFWFFTWLMLGTAVVFVVVAILYKPRTYLQDEAPAE